MATSRTAKSGQKKSAKKSAKKPARKSAKQQARPRQGAARLPPGHAPIENGGGGSDTADPPIIVSGGSVTIKSAVQLTESYTDGFYYYSTTEVTVGRIKTKGKKIQEDNSDGGKFTIELWKKK